MEIIILTLVTIGIFVITYAGTTINDDRFKATFYLVIGTILITIAILTTSTYVKETSIRKYVNNEITYDTIAVDKNGKLLEIKVIKNE